MVPFGSGPFWMWSFFGCGPLLDVVSFGCGPFLDVVFLDAVPFGCGPFLDANEVGFWRGTSARWFLQCPLTFHKILFNGVNTPLHVNDIWPNLN